jgi:hypothetical protein
VLAEGATRASGEGTARAGWNLVCWNSGWGCGEAGLSAKRYMEQTWHIGLVSVFRNVAWQPVEAGRVGGCWSGGSAVQEQLRLWLPG